jgi:hypothetical protein
MSRRRFSLSLHCATLFDCLPLEPIVRKGIFGGWTAADDSKNCLIWMIWGYCLLGFISVGVIFVLF